MKSALKRNLQQTFSSTLMKWFAGTKEEPDEWLNYFRNNQNGIFFIIQRLACNGIPPVNQSILVHVKPSETSLMSGKESNHLAYSQTQLKMQTDKSGSILPFGSRQTTIDGMTVKRLCIDFCLFTCAHAVPFVFILWKNIFGKIKGKWKIPADTYIRVHCLAYEDLAGVSYPIECFW